MLKHIKQIILVSIIILVIDLYWLSLFLGKYFGNMVLQIHGEDMVIDKYKAAVAYSFMVLSFYYFIVLKNNRNMYLDSFLLGLCIYGIFEFTSGAIFKKWKILPLVVDTLWGGVLYLLTYSVFTMIIYWITSFSMTEDW